MLSVRSAIDVQPAQAADLPTLIKVLARSFNNDPVYSWIFRQDAKRMWALERVFSFILNQAVNDGEIITTKSREACAVWFSSGKGELDLSVWSVLRLLPEMLRWAKLDRLTRLSKTLNTLAENRPKKPHYYLEYLAVHPDQQGKGIGSALLKAQLGRIDSKRIPTFLENSNERNNPLYERHGFRITREVTLGDTEPKLWFMWREPI